MDYSQANKLCVGQEPAPGWLVAPAETRMGFLGGLDGALPGAAVVVAVAVAGGVGCPDPGRPENYRGRHSAGDELGSIADLHLCSLLCESRNNAVARTCLPMAHEA